MLGLHGGKSRATHGLRLLLEPGSLVGFGGDQHSIQPLEITVDVLRLHDGLDAVDGGGVAGCRESRAGRFEQAFEFAKVVVQHGGQVGGSSAGLAGAQPGRRIEYLHVCPGALQ